MDSDDDLATVLPVPGAEQISPNLVVEAQPDPAWHAMEEEGGEHQPPPDDGADSGEARPPPDWWFDAHPPKQDVEEPQEHGWGWRYQHEQTGAAPPVSIEGDTEVDDLEEPEVVAGSEGEKGGRGHG